MLPASIGFFYVFILSKIDLYISSRIALLRANIKTFLDITEEIYKFVQLFIHTFFSTLTKLHTMKYFADRLKNARKMNGYSLQELSDKIQNQLSKQDLNRLETGVMMPDSIILNMLTNALQVTTDYFFKEQPLTLESVEFRKLTKLPIKEQEKVKGKTVEFLERYVELENLLGIVKKAPFKFQGYKINDANDIDKAANEMRLKILKIGSDPISNICELLEENGIKIYPISTARKEFSGMSTIIDNSLMVIVFNDDASIPLVRKRFTILHELAHLFLDLSSFDDKQEERMCDAFANAMLLPTEKVREYFGGKRERVFINELKIIKEYYGISLPAIMYRAKTLNLISEHNHKYFMITYNQYYKVEESKGYKGKEESQRFMQLLMRAVAQEVITTTKASALNNQKLGDFRKQYLDMSLN